MLLLRVSLNLKMHPSSLLLYWVNVETKAESSFFLQRKDLEPDISTPAYFVQWH